ncbi:MAG: alpha/beta fold hydrolase [Gammaproteobacteria bacterium]|nr:alpha/beta fold hydrolase [Gammaproteobacteria bacterium]
MNALPEELLAVQAPSPAWFDWAITQPYTAHQIVVEGCRINYLSWPYLGTEAKPPGILFIHGGGAHAHWWRFTAPFFAGQFKVAAMDLAGMGDSGTREDYAAHLRVAEIQAVLDAAHLGEKPYLVGHSLGGFMSALYANYHRSALAGTVIVDSPIVPPEHPKAPGPPPDMQKVRTYRDFATGLARFALRPEQPAAPRYLHEFIGRHSLQRQESGDWTWKFDPLSLHPRYFAEPYHEHLQSATCKRALIYGQHSALIRPQVARYMRRIMGAQSPVLEIPAAYHHLMLDQPIAFISTLRMLLAIWLQARNS